MRCSTDIRAWVGFSCVLIVIAVAAAISACSKSIETIGEHSIKVYFTCDTDGRFEPCGCFSGQHGGLTRLKTYLDDQGGGALLADVGDAIDGTADYQVIKYQYIQQAYAEMHYSALNMGWREARLSRSVLRKLNEHAPVPMISANLVDSQTGQRLLTPYRIVDSHGVKVAFVGVVEPMQDSDNLGDGVAIESMSAALSKVLPELRGKADVMVLLAFASEEAMKQLAREFYEFDIILGGRVREPAQRLIKENRSVIAYTTNESKAVGVIEATLQGHSKVQPGNFNIVFLSDKIAQSPDFLAKSEAYRDEIRMTHLALDRPDANEEGNIPGVAPTGAYVGSESCAACHPSAYRVWQNSAHSHAFQSLTAKRADADPSCIGCHTVGFGTPTGYRREYAGSKLVGVGCETCHGPGSEHVRQRLAGEKVMFNYRPLAAADCTSCHYGEFSRPFDYKTFWQMIRHTKEAQNVQSTKEAKR